MMVVKGSFRSLETWVWFGVGDAKMGVLDLESREGFQLKKWKGKKCKGKAPMLTPAPSYLGRRKLPAVPQELCRRVYAWESWYSAAAALSLGATGQQTYCSARFG